MTRPPLRIVLLVGLLAGGVVDIAVGSGEGQPVFLSPRALSISPDGRWLYAACEDGETVLSIDATTGRVAGRLSVGSSPRGLAIGPHGRRLYVSLWSTDQVGVIEVAPGGELTLGWRLDVGTGPKGLVTDRQGEFLYVANERSSDLSIVDLERRTEVRRLLAGRRPQQLARSPDGTRIYASSLLSLPVPYRSPPRLELTAVDTGSRRVAARYVFEGANIGRGVAVSPDGGLVLVTLMRPKNLVPFTQLAQGWAATNALGVLAVGREDSSPLLQLNIDQPQKFYADPHAVTFSPDGVLAFVASAGSDTVTVVRTDALRELAASTDSETIDEYADDLGMYRRFVVARVSVGPNPTDLVVSPDGRFLYVAERMSDSISVIDISSAPAGRVAVVKTFELNSGTPETLVRQGQRLFHSAHVSFQSQLSCASCHPENHVDGLAYDLEPDGLGRNLVDNRSLVGIRGTAPFKWSGANPDLATQDGPRAAKFIFRSTGFGARGVVAVTAFLRSLNGFPAPREAGEEHVRARRRRVARDRGRAIFERDRDSRGNAIPALGRCVTCHPPPLFTSGRAFDVGTRGPHDRSAVFDTPHLIGIAESAPYLHDGRSPTLEEVWTVFGNDDRHGVVSDLTKSQLNDLIEYLKSL